MNALTVNTRFHVLSITPYMSRSCFLAAFAPQLHFASARTLAALVEYTVHSTITGFTLHSRTPPLPATHAYHRILEDLAHATIDGGSFSSLHILAHRPCPLISRSIAFGQLLLAFSILTHRLCLPVLAYDHILTALTGTLHSHTPPLPPHSCIRSYFDSRCSLSTFTAHVLAYDGILTALARSQHSHIPLLSLFSRTIAFREYLLTFRIIVRRHCTPITLTSYLTALLAHRIHGRTFLCTITF